MLMIFLKKEATTLDVDTEQRPASLCTPRVNPAYSAIPVNAERDMQASKMVNHHIKRTPAGHQTPVPAIPAGCLISTQAQIWSSQNQKSQKGKRTTS